MAPGWELVPGKNKPCLQAWNFQPHPTLSGEERRAGNGVQDPLCLREEAFIKVPKA